MSSLINNLGNNSGLEQATVALSVRDVNDDEDGGDVDRECVHLTCHILSS
jgi:hypothetical protein